MVPSSLNTTPVVSPRLCWYESEELNVAVSTSVALSPSETVKVPPTLILPVSLRAVRSWLGITYIVNVFVAVPLPVSSV